MASYSNARQKTLFQEPAGPRPGPASGPNDAGVIYAGVGHQPYRAHAGAADCIGMTTPAPLTMQRRPIEPAPQLIQLAEAIAAWCKEQGDQAREYTTKTHWTNRTMAAQIFADTLREIEQSR